LARGNRSHPAMRVPPLAKQPSEIRMPRGAARSFVHPAGPWVLLAACAIGMVSPAAATPPQPPLDFDLRALEAPTPGRPVPCAVTVTPRALGESLKLRIVLPRDCALVDGDTLRIGPAPSVGEPRRFDFSVRVPPGLRRYIYVRAELTTPSGHVWTRGQ